MQLTVRRIVAWALFLGVLWVLFGVVRHWHNPFGAKPAAAQSSAAPSSADADLAAALHIPGCAEKGCGK